jgi:hypothetical protein
LLGLCGAMVVMALLALSAAFARWLGS